jgi:protein-disulfide isomerase
MQNNNQYVAIAIVIVGLLIAGAIYYRPSTAPSDGNQATDKAAALQQAKDKLAKMDPVRPTEHLLGSTQAPLVLIEYSDLECPFCKAFHRTTQSLSEKYVSTDQLAIAFRHFPLNIHPKAVTEAAAAVCVSSLAGNDKFWQYLDKIFETTPSNNGLDLALLPKLAVDLGIDETKFKACLEDKATKSLIETETQKGLDIGVDGTPFVVIVNDKGEKLLPFYEPVPENWSDTSKTIIAELLASYEAEIDKLRSGN